MLTRRRVMTAASILAAPAVLRTALSATARAQGGTTVLLQQPVYDNGIVPNFSVTGQFPQYNPVGVFYLHANQPNPYRTDNLYVPMLWDAGAKTGLHCPPDRRNWQLGIWPPSDPSGTGLNHTTAQVYGGAVGAYLNSADLIHGSPESKMMISPNYQLATPRAVFTRPTSVVGVALDLQVPVATDAQVPNVSNTYVCLDMLFQCVNGARLSVSNHLFNHGTSRYTDGANFDQPTQTTIVAPAVMPTSNFVTLMPNSATLQSQPWTGWKHFAFTVSQAQFAAGIAGVSRLAASQGYALSTNPGDYKLMSTHLNAELHYTPSMPSTLGWSMQNLAVVSAG